ncbi:MAG TPA: YceI family protein [Chitinophagaceae bacterium]
MKSALSFVVLLAGLLAVKAQQYHPVDEKSEVRFTVKNFGLNTEGSLVGLKGSIKFNPSDLSTSSFDVSVDVNSINTGIDSRDSHIKKEDYFDVGRYPTVNFVSTGISQNQNDYAVTGKLTIKGITKTISFPFTVQNQDNGLLLTGSFIINRKDFNIGESSAVLGNTVNVSLKVFAK